MYRRANPLPAKPIQELPASLLINFPVGLVHPIKITVLIFFALLIRGCIGLIFGSSNYVNAAPMCGNRAIRVIHVDWEFIAVLRSAVSKMRGSYAGDKT